MARNMIVPLSTPVKRRVTRSNHQADEEREIMESTYEDVESRRKSKVKAERASRKRSPDPFLSEEEDENKTRKRLRLDIALSPIKTRSDRRTPTNPTPSFDLRVLWEQNIASRLTRLGDLPSGCEAELYGEDPLASRLSPLYAGLIFAFSSLEVMLGTKGKLSVSIHDLTSSSSERQALLVDEELWLPKNRDEFDQWATYLGYLAAEADIDAIPAQFVAPTVYVIARIQREMGDFLEATHLIKMGNVLRVSSYMKK